MTKLPTSKALGEEIPRCPWCAGFLDGAKLDLQEVVLALQAHDGAAYLMGVPVDCPDCGKPSELEVVQRGDEQKSYLRGVRTIKDKMLLGEPI